MRRIFMFSVTNNLSTTTTPTLPVAPLSLIGIGYLEEIIFSNNRYVARLKLLPCYNAEGRAKEEVMLNCVVNTWESQSLLDALNIKRTTGCAVIVRFIACYHE